METTSLALKAFANPQTLDPSVLDSVIKRKIPAMVRDVEKQPANKQVPVSLLVLVQSQGWLATQNSITAFGLIEINGVGERSDEQQDLHRSPFSFLLSGPFH